MACVDIPNRSVGRLAYPWSASLSEVGSRSTAAGAPSTSSHPGEWTSTYLGGVEAGSNAGPGRDQGLLR